MHPDQHADGRRKPERTERMGEVNEAYKTLKEFFPHRPVPLRREELGEPLDVGA
jgi:DnaJ-domain-containing protein 1